VNIATVAPLYPDKCVSQLSKGLSIRIAPRPCPLTDDAPLWKELAHRDHQLRYDFHADRRIRNARQEARDFAEQQRFERSPAFRAMLAAQLEE
jgi:hypothetical protein